MSIQPLITFKAGQCDLSVSILGTCAMYGAYVEQGSAPNHKVKPQSTPGYVYLYQGEDGS